MNRRINSRVIGLTVIAILITAIAMTGVYYHLFRVQIRDDMRQTALLLEELEDFRDASVSDFRNVRVKERVTWIAADGTVLLDNEADPATMENHSDRPEVKEALADGEGEAVRGSDTLGISTYYFALRMSDGTVLRIAQDARSLASLFFSAMPMILLILVLLVTAAVLLTHFLSRQIMAPIIRIVAHMDDPAIEDVSDYPELRPLLKTIRAQHDRILEGAKMRQDFTANVSHELKTPLTAITGYSELIENGMVEGERAKAVAVDIHKNASRLLKLINDIIRLTELDRSTSVQNRSISERNEEDETIDAENGYELIDLDELASQCVEELRMNAERAGLTLAYRGEPCRMRGNRDMIRDLIYNLGENAIRYNRKDGYVNISVERQDDHPVLTVADNGIGIPKEQQERVFERFYRVDKSRSRQTGGTGLGLSIVKHVAELHHAKIQLTSEVGVGTTIVVRF